DAHRASEPRALPQLHRRARHGPAAVLLTEGPMKHGMRYRRADAFERARAPSWDPFECAPAGEVRRVQEERLARQMAWLEARSVFYQRKLSEAGIAFADIRLIEDLARVPFTLKTEL